MDFQWAMDQLRYGGGKRVRRKCWAVVCDYTRETPPLAIKRVWHLWLTGDYRKPDVLAKDYWTGGIINGWGGQVGAFLEPNEPIRDGQTYSSTESDRSADDWELYEPC